MQQTSSTTKRTSLNTEGDRSYSSLAKSSSHQGREDHNMTNNGGNDNVKEQTYRQPGAQAHKVAVTQSDGLSTDLSRRVKIAPILKVRRGSHDSFRMADEIHYEYRALGSNRDNFGEGVTAGEWSSLSPRRRSAPKAGIRGYHKEMARHAGEAAGGLLMMRKSR